MINPTDSQGLAAERVKQADAPVFRISLLPPMSPGALNARGYGGLRISSWLLQDGDQGPVPVCQHRLPLLARLSRYPSRTLSQTTGDPQIPICAIFLGILICPICMRSRG